MNFIEVCAGAGGLSTGFINKGFKPIFLNDINKDCCNTLKENHPNIKIINDSMNNIKWEEYECDILMGGIPCQSFSTIGKRKGLQDKRGTLMLDFISIILRVNPKIFIIENVKGLLTHDKGNTLKTILKKIKGYNIKHKILNANDYGVPQKRERLFIIGVRQDIEKEYTFPSPQQYKPILKDILLDCPESEGLKYNQKKFNIMQQIPEDGCWIDLPINIQKEYMKNINISTGGNRGILKRLSMNKPCLTLLTSPSQKQTERCHPIETRPLTIREYARIQTFPDNYKFCGSLMNQYKMIGNAVPIKLSEQIAMSIFFRWL